MADIRLNTTVFAHHKILKLGRRLKDTGVLCLIRLWAWAGDNKPTGVLYDMSAEDVELVAGWTGKAGELVKTLQDLHLLDKAKSGYVIHDWEEHQPWMAHAKERSEAARNAARKRWEKRNDAKGMRTACAAHAESNALCNAPSPTPNPNPTPNPTPTYKKQPSAVPAPGPQPTQKPQATKPKARSKKKTPKPKKAKAKPQEPKGPNVWGLWVDESRALNLPDPVPDGPDLAAGKRLGPLVADREELAFCMRRYLRDEDLFIAKQGHPLRALPGRLNRYRKDFQKKAKADAERREAEEQARKLEEDLARQTPEQRAEGEETLALFQNGISEIAQRAQRSQAPMLVRKVRL